MKGNTKKKKKSLYRKGPSSCPNHATGMALEDLDCAAVPRVWIGVSSCAGAAGAAGAVGAAGAAGAPSSSFPTSPAI